MRKTFLRRPLAALPFLLAAAGWNAGAPPLTDGGERDYSILLRGHRLEPSPAGDGVSAEADQEATARPYIVQFDGPLSRDQTGLLKERLGLRLNEYVPHFAFLERLDTAQLAALRRLDFFRWLGPYEPRFKIDPMIGKHVFQTEERRAESGLLLTVVAFPGGRLAELAGRVRQLGFEVVSTTDEPELGIQRLQVRVGEIADVERLARLEDVRYIEEVGEVTLNEPPHR